MRARQMTFMCIVSGFIGAFIAMACGATDGGKDVYADDDIVDDGDGDITPIDDVILTKRIVDCTPNWDDPYWVSDCYDNHLNGTEVHSAYYIKNGQRDASGCLTNQNCDSFRLVIIE
ncbi:MAG: hypothetical protein VX278_15690 [Myxococcota bacterium]|nr:hypothetical protein [Myxococcota bacterium]